MRQVKALRQLRLRKTQAEARARLVKVEQAIVQLGHGDDFPEKVAVTVLPSLLSVARIETLGGVCL